MCSFKHCRKSGQCFLAKVSPCPNKPESIETKATDIGFQYDGFLEPNKLLSELGFMETAPKPAAKKQRKKAA